MDLNTIIIGLIISSVIIVPIVFIQMTQNRQKKKAKKHFIEEAKSKNVHVSEMDFWGTYYAIALDASENKLVYSKITEEENVWITADLKKPSIRFSFSIYNTKDEIDYVISVLKEFVKA